MVSALLTKRVAALVGLCYYCCYRLHVAIARRASEIVSYTNKMQGASDKMLLVDAVFIQYLFSIYTVFKQYLFSIYKVFVQYLFHRTLEGYV